ncbi:MAG TPA: formate--tetrahydrofolate ligase, partial [Candidatus Brocadiia bacterium]|nr:formate--tetrahydrofolate ligase [Candidatus Brocadiia bacterium]
CAGAMAVLLKDAIKPTLMQTLEHTPCFVHAGPFANIAHGNNSIIADRIALKLGEIVVTESGFGADCGMEKFFNIKCRAGGLVPNAVVIVATVRALKMHSGRYRVLPGRPIPKSLNECNVKDVEAGCVNLVQHIENTLKFGVPVVVAVNRFKTDGDAEIEAVRRAALKAGARAVCLSEVWKDGGDGAIELAKAVWEAASQPSKFKYLYELDWPIKKKIETVAREIYRADGVDYSPVAEAKLKLYTEAGFDKLPLCMAKTHLSFSHDPNLKGAPRGFVLPIKDVRASVGAGFIYPLCGEMRTMPSLPSHPAGENVDLDENGNVVGLF